MINIRKNLIFNAPGEAAVEAPYTWIDARDLNRDDISVLSDEYGLSTEQLADFMDPDEQSRIQSIDGRVSIIIRIPNLTEDDSDSSVLNTVPLGVILYDDKVLTVCQTDSLVLEDLAKNRFRQYPLQTREGFVLSILGRATQVFLRLLKLVNRRKNQVESKLSATSIGNIELMELLAIQKDLVYYSTGLAMNQELLERLRDTGLFCIGNQAEKGFLENVITDNAQALSMARLYARILTVTTESFSTVIQNNIHTVTRRIAVIALLLLCPLLVMGFFAMNVRLPFTSWDPLWIVIPVLGLLASGIGVWLFLKGPAVHVIENAHSDADKSLINIQRRQRAREVKRKKRLSKRRGREK